MGSEENQEKFKTYNRQIYIFTDKIKTEDERKFSCFLKKTVVTGFWKKSEFTEETTNVLPIFDYIPAKIYRNIDFFGPKKNHPQPASVQFVLNLRILLK